MKNATLTTLFMLFVPHLALPQENISLHPENSHYFFYKNQPTLLITSGEHYGAVINLDFDYRIYFDELKANRLNLTRVFTGVYLEPPGSFNISGNTLAPAPQKFICPWARSSEPGNKAGGNKFDLSRWDETYFGRLSDFMNAARDRGVIVELALFCPFYEDAQWEISPMNAGNNINKAGKVRREDVYTMDKNGGLIDVHENLVRKIVTALKEFDNVIYEICNEPYWGGVKMDWQHHIAGLIRETEDSLGVRHLISQNIANGSGIITDPHPAVSVFNFHYATPPVAVSQNYHLNKVIGDNETGFDGNSDSTYRVEGWEFILAGGGLYNNLDYSFTASHEDGTFQYPSSQPGGGSKALREQLGYLKAFMDLFNFIRMKPDSSIVTSGLSPKVRVHVLAEEGKQYAVYVFGKNQSSLAMKLPPGNYLVESMDPVSGKYTSRKKLKHSGGQASVALPAYGYDLALRLTAEDPTGK